MPSPVVAVIDIGSNSIKVLVTQRNADGHLSPLLFETQDVRISAGIGKATPILSEAGMAGGISAVQTLLAHTEPFHPTAVVLVATSAVRDAKNGGEFRQRMKDVTGHAIRILSGEEEANLIGRGLLADEALAHLEDFYVFDLGGGSLECLSFKQRHVSAAVSLPLGCVRLTEKHVADSTKPFDEFENRTVQHVVRSTLEASGFPFDLGASANAVFTGGTMTVARASISLRVDSSHDKKSSVVSVEEIRELFAQIASLPLDVRKKFPGLPAARADVFPAGLSTILALAEFGQIDRFYHSHYNLRWGLAAEILSGK